MRYQEFALPEYLHPFVSAVWTMHGEGVREFSITREAMPDGCIEVIRRIKGESSWCHSQPDLFVAGMCSKPAKLEMSGDAEFIGIRLWPWAWKRLGIAPCPSFLDRWLPLDQNSVAGQLLAVPSRCIDALHAAHSCAPDPIGRHVPDASRTDDLVERSGRNHRTIQRWFQKEIGLTPRRYFKLLRFQRAVEPGADSGDTLAGQAASLGYADQAHMSRDFRHFAEEPISRVRQKADGPFLDGSVE